MVKKEITQTQPHKESKVRLANGKMMTWHHAGGSAMRR
jgi:hypothetical protein